MLKALNKHVWDKCWHLKNIYQTSNQQYLYDLIHAKVLYHDGYKGGEMVNKKELPGLTE